MVAHDVNTNDVKRSSTIPGGHKGVTPGHPTTMEPPLPFYIPPTTPLNPQHSLYTPNTTSHLDPLLPFHLLLYMSLFSPPFPLSFPSSLSTSPYIRLFSLLPPFSPTLCTCPFPFAPLPLPFPLYILPSGSGETRIITSYLASPYLSPSLIKSQTGSH